MAAYEELAPELSQAVTEAEAEAFAQNVISQGTPSVPKTLLDLSPALQAFFLKWVQWLGRSSVPAGLPEWIKWSPKRVAATG